MRRVEGQDVTGMSVGIENEEVRASEERTGSMWCAERQTRDLERGRQWGGEWVVEREKREVERGRGGSGERGKEGERGSSIMGCRMSTEVWQVEECNVLQEQRKGQSVGHRKTGPLGQRNKDVSQKLNDEIKWKL